MARDYTKLDELILKALRAGARQFDAIREGEVDAECKRLSADANGALSKQAEDDAFRHADRRIQALKKAGKIQFAKGAGGGWSIVAA